MHGMCIHICAITLAQILPNAPDTSTPGENVSAMFPPTASNKSSFGRGESAILFMLHIMYEFVARLGGIASRSKAQILIFSIAISIEFGY